MYSDVSTPPWRRIPSIAGQAGTRAPYSTIKLIVRGSGQTRSNLRNMGVLNPQDFRRYLAGIIIQQTIMMSGAYLLSL